jgi:hypothetical protein
MNQKLWIQYPQHYCQMLRPFDELPSFGRNKIKEQKIKSLVFLSKQKTQQKRDCQILVGQLHRLST